MIVIDASVANKIFLPHEHNHTIASSIIQNHILQIEGIIVPDFLFYEVANTLATKGVVSAWKVTNAITKLYQIDLKIHPLSEGELKEAARMARRHYTSVYDMIYAVVAKKHKVVLITADEKFADATKFKFVKLLKDLD